jgi:hypothetical protein
MKIEYPEKPVWEPLQAVVLERVREFMFMGQVTGDAGPIYLYKHVWTRRYLNLDQEGKAYRFTGYEYEPRPLDEAIKHVFD